MAITQTQILQLTMAMFKATPGAVVNADLLAAAAAGMSITDMANALATKSAFNEVYPTSMTNAAFAYVFINDLVGSNVAQADKDWAIAQVTTKLAAGQSRAEVIWWAAESLAAVPTTDATWGAAAQQFANKVEVSNYYTVTRAQGTGTSTLAELQAPTASVTADAASVTAAKNVIDHVGSTYTLTTGTDTFVGTANNDTFTGAVGTVQNADSMIDASTTDNDTANLVLAANYTPGNISNVENINISWDAYTTPTFNLTSVSGAKAINLTSSKVGYLGNATVTNFGTNGTLTAGDGIVGLLTVSGITNGTVNVGAATTTVIDGTGTNANNVAVTVNAGAGTTSVDVGSTNGFKSTAVDAGTATTVKVSDAQTTSSVTNLTIGASANVTANNLGAMTMNIASGKTATMVTGGSVIGTGLTIVGDGNATLSIAGADLTTETVTNSKTSGTLTVKASGTGATNVASVQADLIEFTGAKAGADTVANGANLKYSAAAGAIEVIIGGTGTADSATATLTGATNTSVTLNGVETLNVIAAATATSGTDLTISTLATAGNKVVLSGANDVALTAITGNGTVDATALAGTLSAGTAASINITGGTGAMTLTSTGAATDLVAVGQGANDTVTTSVAAGTVTAILGAGNNTVTAASLTSGTLVVVAGAGNDTVTVTGGTVDSGTLNLNLGDGNNTVSYTDDGATANSTTIVTGAGDDTVSIGASTVADDVLSLTLGEGTDTVNVANAVDLSLGTVTFGGADVIQLTAGANSGIFAAATLTGQSYTMKATNTAGDSFKIVGKATTATINASTLTIDQTVNKAVLQVNIDNAAATVASTITGTAIADAILGGTKADVIVAGNGQDTITGGAGNDSIDLTESAANQVADMLLFNAAATNGKDTITGFKVNTDQLTLKGADTTVVTGAGAAAVDTVSVALTNGAAAWVVGAGVGTLDTTTADVLIIGTTLSSNGDLDLATDGTELLKALSSTTTAATQLTVAAAANKLYFIAYQDGNSYLFHGDAGAGNTAIVASELKLVGVFNGIVASTHVAADFLVDA